MIGENQLARLAKARDAAEVVSEHPGTPHKLNKKTESAPQQSPRPGIVSGRIPWQQSDYRKYKEA